MFCLTKASCQIVNIIYAVFLTQNSQHFWLHTGAAVWLLLFVDPGRLNMNAEWKCCLITYYLQAFESLRVCVSLISLLQASSFFQPLAFLCIWCLTSPVWLMSFLNVFLHMFQSMPQLLDCCIWMVWHRKKQKKVLEQLFLTFVAWDPLKQGLLNFFWHANLQKPKKVQAPEHTTFSSH